VLTRPHFLAGSVSIRSWSCGYLLGIEFCKGCLLFSSFSFHYRCYGIGFLNQYFNVVAFQAGGNFVVKTVFLGLVCLVSDFNDFGSAG